MTLTTTNMGLLQAQGGDNARDYLKTYLLNSLTSIDTHDHSSTKGVPVKRLANGTFASRPAVGNAGHVYVATDSNRVFWDNGTAWLEAVLQSTTQLVTLAGGLTVSTGLATLAGGLTVSAGNITLAGEIIFSGANAIWVGGTVQSQFYNNAGNVANLTILDAGGLLLQGATPAGAVSQLGLGTTTQSPGAGATATLGTVGGSGPAAAAQNTWLQVSLGGINYFVPLWH